MINNIWGYVSIQKLHQYKINIGQIFCTSLKEYSRMAWGMCEVIFDDISCYIVYAYLSESWVYLKSRDPTNRWKWLV